MRFLLVFGLGCGLAFSLRAQEQDPGLLLQTRNEGIASKLFQNRSFYDGKTFSAVKSANVRPFYFPQRYDAAKFSTKDYRAQTYWQGEIPFATKAAATKKDPRGDKQYATQPAPVKDARESGKGYGTREYANAREFRDVGKSQKALDQQHNQKPMTSDEVRELLNKNK